MEAGKPQPLEDQLPQDLRATASIDDVAATLPVRASHRHTAGLACIRMQGSSCVFAHAQFRLEASSFNDPC
jgi:hypothetical protein